MASVESTRAKKYSRCGVIEDEPPDHIECAGELLIKKLVEKQVKTNLTLNECLKEKKTFKRGIGVVSLGEISAGTSSLQQFEEKYNQAERVGELEGKGFSRTEALELVKGKRQSKATPAAQDVFQNYIDHHLNCTQSAPTANYTGMKRQEWELALSVKPNSLETRLYQFAVKNNSSITQSNPPISKLLDHPINNLAAIEQNLLQTADPQSIAKTFRRKRRQQVEALAEPVIVHYKSPNGQGSLWDTSEIPEAIKNHLQVKKIATCKNKVLYTIKDKKVVQLSDKTMSYVENHPVDQKYSPNGQKFVLLQGPSESPKIIGKLSEEEIKQLPRFKNYERGNISRTLYIKNLPSNVTETDLAHIFNEFLSCNEEKVVFRLMSGKLRGQAFVTFSSSKEATSALEATNGTILKGKAMIIQYGKHQD